ncbi:MAG: hypothetical protein ABTQ32_22770 [Myxococcaceae bacterium]
MWKFVFAVVLSGAPQKAKYEISPCSILGRLDGGVGGMECTEPISGGFVTKLHWEDGRRERVTSRRVDGGIVETVERWAADASVPKDW